MLRNYQIQSIKDFESSMEKNILLSLPTGAGKTFTFCEIAKRFFAEHTLKVLILVHRTELLNQTVRSLGARCFEISAGIKTIPHTYDFYVAMVETTHRRLEKLPKFGLVVIDEAHFGNFKKMPFFQEQNTKLLGVTATPIAEFPLADYYDKLLLPISITELIENNYLLNCKSYGFASQEVGSQKFKVKGGDFDEKQMMDFYSSEKMVLNVIEAYWKLSAGKKSLIFNVNIEHNNIVYSVLKNEGLNVYRIDGGTPKNEREQILKNFKTQPDAIICNVGVLTTGFDEPTIETIILNRATKSLALYLQMIGRGSRTYENKEFFTVIDLGLNVKRHGFYDDVFDWENFFKFGKSKGNGKEGAMPVKECPKCNSLVHTRVDLCPTCGHDFAEQREQDKKQEKERKLIELIRKKPVNIPIERIIEIAKERNHKDFAVLHKIAEHVVNYEKNNDIDLIENFELIKPFLLVWCKEYNRATNGFYNKILKEMINEKRGQNTTGNSNLRS
jgi:type I site-specific restriction endonuclease